MAKTRVAKKPDTRTTNGMAAFTTTSSSVVDLFYSAGASRGKDITSSIKKALGEDPEFTGRLLLWLRDVREGAGERELFRQALAWMEKNDVDRARRLMKRVPDLGRWDDLFALKGALRTEALDMIAEALKAGNGLCAKWMPREKSSDRKIAVEIMQHMGLKPKDYRKLLVNATNVVETKMCARQWDQINFSHVPSVAASIYRSAFFRNAPEAFGNFVNRVKSGDPTVKVNASSIFPYDVIKDLGQKALYSNGRVSLPQTELDHITNQWNALPNFVGDSSILPLVDVSGSMSQRIGENLNALDVAVSLGLYLSQKNTGKFKDLFMTFSGRPEMIQLTGTIVDRINTMVKSNWSSNTDLAKCMDLILDIATKHKVPQSEMPQSLLIISDMQFDQCVQNRDSTAVQMIRKKFEKAGYTMPGIVFWNVAAAKNAPAKHNTSGVGLVSGFSPSIVSSLGDVGRLTPLDIVVNKLAQPRYNY